MRPAVAIMLVAVIIAAPVPVLAQSITCPPGTTRGGTESEAGKFHWCEQTSPGGPIRQGPMVGFHPNGRRSFELNFVDGSPRGSVRAWYEGGQPSMTGETRPDNGTLILWDERGRRRAQVDVRDRVVATRAWVDRAVDLELPRSGGGPAAALGIGPLGVHPDLQRHGVGGALMHGLIGAAEALDETLLGLLGEPAYYRRFGFVAASELGVFSPDPAWGTYFQARRLTENPPLGAFRYADPFNQLD